MAKGKDKRPTRTLLKVRTRTSFAAQAAARSAPTHLTKATTRAKAARPSVTAGEVRKALRMASSPERAIGVARFFKTGKGEYGEGDIFIGCTVGDQRTVARESAALPLADADTLLQSKIHEERLTALLILVRQFEKGDEPQRRRIYQLYLKRLPFINNWDLVDLSADPIVGGWLADKDRSKLDRLARSSHLWTRRVAMVATFNYIKKGESAEALRIAELLLDDTHDLIHKAAGWMLREVGKRVDPKPLLAFLEQHAAIMPRTMLRYAIEHRAPAERAKWLAMRAQLASSV